MSFRIEQKLNVDKENLLDLKEFLIKKNAKGLHEPRVIESLYFDNYKKLQYYYMKKEPCFIWCVLF